MVYDIHTILSTSSIFLAIGISIFRLRYIAELYHPVIYLLWLGGANEILSYILISNGYYNVINSNIYNLIEAFLILYYFKRTAILNGIKMLFPFLILLLVIIWFIDNFWMGTFGLHFNSYFNIVAGLPVVLISINLMNEIVIREREILKNPNFLLCSGFIIYFTYRILVEAFYLNGAAMGKPFMSKVYEIHSWINLLCNLIYALAVLWMTRRQAFTLRY